MTERTFGELKRLAREFLTGNYAVPIFAALAAVFLPVLVLAPFSVGVTSEWNAALAIYVLASLIVEVLMRLLLVGVLRIHLQLAKKEQVKLPDLFWAFRNCPDRFILDTLLLFGMCLIPILPVAVCACFFIKIKSIYKYALLSVALIAAVAVLLYIALTFGFVYPLHIENPQMDVLEGFRKSQELMKGNKKRLLLLLASFLGWSLLGLCSLGIGWIWISPYMTQTIINFYLDLTNEIDRKAEHIDIVV